MHFGIRTPVIYAQHVSRTCVWRQLNSGRSSLSKNMKFSSRWTPSGMQRYTLATVYARTFKQRLYLFYKIMLVRERFCSCCDALVHVVVCVADRERKILFPRGISSSIDRDTYVSRIDIVKIFPKHRNGMSIWRGARARTRRSENIFDHFELVCQHFALDEPAHSMDVSIIRNVNFRRRNIIHTL